MVDLFRETKTFLLPVVIDMGGILSKSYSLSLSGQHEGNTMRKIMGNKPQVSSAIIIHSPLQISWNDLLHHGQTADVSIIRAKTAWNDLLHHGQTADVSIIRAKTGTFSIETLDGRPGLV
jgi:hypothetical protein